MTDKIVPSEGQWLAETDLCQNWRRLVFSDEVFWLYKPTEDGEWHRIVRFPFVPGYFLCDLLCCNGVHRWDSDTHYPVSGPFPSLKSAMAAVIIAGPIKEST